VASRPISNNDNAIIILLRRSADKRNAGSFYSLNDEAKRRAAGMPAKHRDALGASA
jgi:hypothetical protein